MTFDMWDFEIKIKKESPPVDEDVEHFSTGQFFETNTGKKFRLYSPVWRGGASEGQIEILGYWFKEISDDPTPYFYKSRPDVAKAKKEGRIRCV